MSVNDKMIQLFIDLNLQQYIILTVDVTSIERYLYYKSEIIHIYIYIYLYTYVYLHVYIYIHVCIQTCDMSTYFKLMLNMLNRCIFALFPVHTVRLGSAALPIDAEWHRERNETCHPRRASPGIG